jgi:hypothetical protein
MFRATTVQSLRWKVTQHNNYYILHENCKVRDDSLDPLGPNHKHKT